MFGDRLKHLRDEKGITQQQLADLMNISRPTIAGYETKRKEPDFEKIVWLSKYFNVSIEYLMGLSDKKEPATESDGRVLKFMKLFENMTPAQQDAMLAMMEASQPKE